MIKKETDVTLTHTYSSFKKNFYQPDSGTKINIHALKTDPISYLCGKSYMTGKSYQCFIFYLKLLNRIGRILFT